MKIIIQRVTSSSVEIDGKCVGQIGKGLLLLIGIGRDTNPDNISKMVEKIINLRIFSDENGKFNYSLLDIKGEVLAISQFTLFANCQKGRRPDFLGAASPELAQNLYNLMVTELKKSVAHVASGVFGAHMEIKLINDGPVTIILDEKELFS